MSGPAVLKVVEAFSSEKNFTVWHDLSTNLSSLSLLLQYTSFHDNFKAFLRQLYSPVMASVGWDAKDGEGNGARLFYVFTGLLISMSVVIVRQRPSASLQFCMYKIGSVCRNE